MANNENLGCMAEKYLQRLLYGIVMVPGQNFWPWALQPRLCDSRERWLKVLGALLWETGFLKISLSTKQGSNWGNYNILDSKMLLS